MNILPARHAATDKRQNRDELVVVTETDGREVLVRWTYKRPAPWRCTDCGRMTTADCAHTFAAGVVLAEQILGLTRNVQLERGVA